MDEKLAALRQTSLFAGLSSKDLEAIGRITDRAPVKQGRELIREGQITTHMYLLINGSANVDIGGNQVATLGPGDVVGEMSMLDSAAASATVTMAEDSEVWLVHNGSFGLVWQDNAEMATAMLMAVVERLRAADKLLSG